MALELLLLLLLYKKCVIFIRFHRESWRAILVAQNKKLSSDLDETEGYVTDEDESAETDRTRKSSKKVTTVHPHLAAADARRVR